MKQKSPGFGVYDNFYTLLICYWKLHWSEIVWINHAMVTSMHTKTVIEMIPILRIEFHTYCCNASKSLNAKSKHETLILVLHSQQMKCCFWRKSENYTCSAYCLAVSYLFKEFQNAAAHEKCKWSSLLQLIRHFEFHNPNDQNRVKYTVYSFFCGLV